MGKFTFVFILASLLLATSCATVPTGVQKLVLPTAPQSAINHGEKPVSMCSDEVGVYVRNYDTNPQTQAQLTEYGYYTTEDKKVTFEKAVVVIVTDDKGDDVFYIQENGKVRNYLYDDFIAKYPNPCDLPGRPGTKV